MEQEHNDYADPPLPRPWWLESWSIFVFLGLVYGLGATLRLLLVKG